MRFAKVLARTIYRYGHFLAFAFILATYYELLWQRIFFPPHSVVSNFLTTIIDAPAALAELLIPHSWSVLLFGWLAPYWDFFLWKGGWIRALPDMTAYLLVFHIPWALRQFSVSSEGLGPQELAGWRLRLGRAAGFAARGWDRLIERRPKFLVGAVLRLAYAYLAAFAIVALRDVNLTRIHDYVTYGLQGLLDLPLTIVGILFPFADRGFDFWLTTTIAPPDNFSSAYLSHMAVGTTTYFFLFYLPNLYIWVRQAVIRLAKTCAGVAAEARAAGSG